MKKTCLILLFLFVGSSSFAQTYGSLSSNNNGAENWVNLGTANLPQGGFDAYLRIIGGAGYNASTEQMGHVDLHIMSSNGASIDANGFGFAATATAYGRMGSFIPLIHIIPNANGVAATSFTVYAYCGRYSGYSFYSAEVSSGCSWTPSNTLASGTPGGYNVPFEFVVNNPSVFRARVGIGTFNVPATYMLAINGSAIATSMTVKLYANWPDYVFKKGYQLPSLSEVKSYIDQNQHLPEMPSEQEIAKDGLNLGEMNKLLVKKVEELTLYLIENQKQVQKQQAQINHLNEQMKVLVKR